MTMINDRYEELKHAERGALLSIVTYLFIATLKLIVANYSGSSALRADGLNNTTDTIASIAVLIGLRLARRPPLKYLEEVLLNYLMDLMKIA